MFEPDLKFENALRFSRLDSDDMLSTTSEHSFELAGRTWPSAEHYYQACKYSPEESLNAFSESLLAISDPSEVFHKGEKWWHKKRPKFKQLQTTLMTRALYSKAQQHPEVKEYLLATGNQLIAESSLYDHYWGIGRDLRGKNMMGRIWMDIRGKLAKP